MNPIKNLYTEQFNSPVSVLLIAEDPSIISPKLEGLFEPIYISQSQHESLSFFYDNFIDLIIIDIDTETYDWRDLVTQFRSKTYDATIALLVDMSHPYDLNAIISAGVTQCLFKPLDPKKLKLSLYDLINKIQHKKDAKANYYYQERRRLSNLTFKALQHVIENIPAPLFAYNAHEKILFYNKSLTSLFANKKIEIPESFHVWNIEDLFENMTKELHFTTINEGKSFELKYYYHDSSIKKIFIPTKFSVTLETDDTPFMVVVLTDIEPLLLQIKMVTYQKQKMDSYKELIRELLEEKTFKENTQKTTHVSHTIQDQNKSVHTFNNPITISAKEYMQNIQTNPHEAMQKLYSTESSLQNAIDHFNQIPTKSTIIKIAELFDLYGEYIKYLSEFHNLSNALCSLSDFIIELPERNIMQHASMDGHFFQTLIENLMQWRITIFETQDTNDIHSLDNAILKSILQFEIALSHYSDQNEYS